MRNVIVISLAAALCICFCNSKDPEDSCTYDGYQLMTYNSSGYINKYELFDANDNGQFYFTYAYNANNYIISATVRNYSGTIIGYVTIVNNNSGDALQEFYMDQDSALLFYYINTYDTNGNILTSSEYSADSVLESVQKFIYDESGKTSSTEMYDSANALLYTNINQRNSDGLLVSVNMVDASGNRIGYKTYVYSSAPPYTVKITFFDCTGKALLKSMPWHQFSGIERMPFIKGFP